MDRAPAFNSMGNAASLNEVGCSLNSLISFETRHSVGTLSSLKSLFVGDFIVVFVCVRIL